MADKFGFTEEEVVKILKHYNVCSDEDKKVIDEWYGGYLVGESVYLYNPWSVINYVDLRVSSKTPEKSAQPFWINTSSNDIVKEQIEKNPSLREKLQELLEGKEIMSSVDPWLSLRELEERREGIWTLLVSGGYLTAKQHSFGRYFLKLPNEEIMYFFKTSVMVWLEKETKVMMGKLLESLWGLLEKGEAGEFAQNLEGYITNALSYFDIGGKEPERVYKAFLLGMLSIAINGYEVESELESGYGRLDVVVYPKEKRYGSYAAIFEVKRADRDEKLEEHARKALEQIKEREYYAKMKQKGYEVIGFGIAFSGKKTSVMVNGPREEKR